MYCERRDAMFAALERYFPKDVVWTRPAGGLFLWVTLPPQVDATELLHVSILEKVAFVPGSSFYPEAPQKNTLRLNFSNSDPARISEGIRRLALVLGMMLEPHHAPNLRRPNGSKHTVPVH
jgi:DNA-binding transcriptional MocR family regulator